MNEGKNEWTTDEGKNEWIRESTVLLGWENEQNSEGNDLMREGEGVDYSEMFPGGLWGKEGEGGVPNYRMHSLMGEEKSG